LKEKLGLQITNKAIKTSWAEKLFESVLLFLKLSVGKEIASKSLPIFIANVVKPLY